MAPTSAALCLWRRQADELQVLVVHPGGPFFARKDNGAWSLPKGEFDPAGETALSAARREFREETGSVAPDTNAIDLGETRLKSGKRIVAFAVEGDLDADAIVSNTFELEWPPRSGTRREFPEVDRALWCSIAIASVKLHPAQVVLVERLAEQLA